MAAAGVVELVVVVEAAAAAEGVALEEVERVAIASPPDICS